MYGDLHMLVAERFVLLKGDQKMKPGKTET